MRTINKPPFAPSLMESTRSIGYSLESAIADIIDNSLAAKSKRIEIDFFPIGEPYLTLLDDGTGMSEEQLIEAMEYGCKNPNEERDKSDLGRYGLGLKTASLSQCGKLTVISKQDNRMSGCRWDLEHIYLVKDWDLLILDKEDFEVVPNIQKLIEKENGVLVVWENMDRLKNGEKDFSLSFGKKMDGVREHIALVFHRYLSGEPGLNKVEILINEARIEASDPFLVKKSTQVMDDETIIIRGQKVKVRPYILPHISKMNELEVKSLGGAEGLRKRQGFYVYRNKRLLVWGTWFRLMRQSDLSKLARVRVDIPNSLDDLWTLDIKKSTATPPEIVRKNLSKILDKIADCSKRTWTHRGKKEISDTRIHFWNRLKTNDNGILYELNKQHPMVEKIIDKNPEVKNSLYSLLNQIQNNIPLNSLYIDLTNDEKLLNETNLTDTEVITLLKSILEQNPDIIKLDIYNKLLDVEPFCNFCESIQSAFEKGEII